MKGRAGLQVRLQRPQKGVVKLHDRARSLAGKAAAVTARCATLWQSRLLVLELPTLCSAATDEDGAVRMGARGCGVGCSRQR
jgi:hypothetical protein